MEWREVYSIKNDRLTNQRMIVTISVLGHMKLLYLQQKTTQ